MQEDLCLLTVEEHHKHRNIEMSDVFRLTKIVIVDSLEPGEFQTGQLLEEYIRHEMTEYGLPLRVERYSVGWPADFESVMHKLSMEAAETGEAPLLHVEMHGDPKDGLIFSEGGSIPWDRVKDLLTEINHATGFNLVSIFAACYGAHFAGELFIHRAAPCFGLLAPEDKVYPEEIYQGFRLLYHELAVTRDMGHAAAFLARQKLSKGRWLNRTAPSWFKDVLRAMIMTHASRKGLDAMTERVMARPEAKDLPKGVDLRAHMEETALHYVRDLTFDRFFMVKEIPENAERFRAVKESVIRDLLPLVGRSC
jgi:hypothetical protein